MHYGIELWQHDGGGSKGQAITDSYSIFCVGPGREVGRL